MKMLFCYTPDDEPTIEMLENWMEDRGVWTEKWELDAGESLLARFRGEKPADRLVVALSPSSMSTHWVRHEVTGGALIEMAEARGYGAGFLTPILLKPCEVPLFLRDRVSANFANKSFEAACQELYTSVEISASVMRAEDTICNRVFRTWNVEPVGTGKHAIVVEFGVCMQRSKGLHVEVDAGVQYVTSKDWFGPPNMPKVPSRPGGPFFNSSLRRQPPIYTRKFQEPDITPEKSYYLYLEADVPLRITERLFVNAQGGELY